MSFPAIISHMGSVQGSPAASSFGNPSLQEFMNTGFSNTLGASKGARIGVVGATLGAPFVIPFETIVRARMLFMRVRGGSIEVRLTSVSGTDQAIKVGDMFIWNNPIAGDEITSIKLIGTADVEYVLAGDTN